MVDKKINLMTQWFIYSNKGKIKEVYHFENRLGQGGFGVVYLATHRKNGNFIGESLAL